MTRQDSPVAPAQCGGEGPADSSPSPVKAQLPPIRQLAPRHLSSASLLEGALEVEIEHKGVIYRLRHTSQGKLILTK